MFHAQASQSGCESVHVRTRLFAALGIGRRQPCLRVSTGRGTGRGEILRWAHGPTRDRGYVSNSHRNIRWLQRPRQRQRWQTWSTSCWTTGQLRPDTAHRSTHPHCWKHIGSCYNASHFTSGFCYCGSFRSDFWPQSCGVRLPSNSICCSKHHSNSPTLEVARRWVFQSGRSEFDLVFVEGGDREIVMHGTVRVVWQHAETNPRWTSPTGYEDSPWKVFESLVRRRMSYVPQQIANAWAAISSNSHCYGLYGMDKARAGYACLLWEETASILELTYSSTHMHAGNPRKLWKNLNAILVRDKKHADQTSTVTAEVLSKFFMGKVSDIRAATEGSAPPAYTEYDGLKFE